jgi:general stress protein 26
MPTKSNFKNPNIASFLKRNHIAVIATANKESGAPHAAAVYYATDSQMNIFFVTKEDTTKSKNLATNPQIAVAIYDAPIQATAQITGTATRVDDPAMLEKALRIMSKHAQETAKTDETPISKLNAGQYILYKIWPQTIRLGEYKYGPHNQLFDIATPAEESLE